MSCSHKLIKSEEKLRLKTTISNLITWITPLSNSVKLWAMPRRATQDGRVMEESSDKTWSTGEGNGKPLQYSWEHHEHMQRQKKRALKEELPGSVGARYATGDQWRTNSRKNEEMEPKQKRHPAADVMVMEVVCCCEEQHCIETWNVRSMNQCKMEAVKQEMARVNIDILGISELKWTRMG